MCLILFHYDPEGGYPLTVMANRDEFHERKTLQAAFWDDAPNILAGRDMEKGGTWMGVSRTGRFAAVTNYRSLADMRPGGASRGDLTRLFLAGEETALDYAERVARKGGSYTGFNLLVSDGTELVYLSNRDREGPIRVSTGFHGLSNAFLDTPWPKVTEGVEALRQSVRRGDPARDWRRILADTSIAPDERLPNTGIGIEKERQLSSRCIEIAGYGTRCSSFVRIGRDGSIVFEEKTLVPAGLHPETVTFSLKRS